MKRSIIISLLILVGLTETFGQAKSKNNVISFEGGGPFVVGIGLGYERYFKVTDNINITGRGGVGLVHEFTQFSPYVGGSMLFGKKSSIELGFNNSFNVDVDALYTPEAEVKDKHAFQLLLGYRYKNEKNGIVFRIYGVPPIGNFSNLFGIPWLGGAIGYSF